MTTVKRYRRRDLIAELIEHEHIPPERVEDFKRGASVWPDHYLTFVFTDLTGKEVVHHKCGLWYAMADTDQDNDRLKP